MYVAAVPQPAASESSVFPSTDASDEERRPPEPPEFPQEASGGGTQLPRGGGRPVTSDEHAGPAELAATPRASAMAALFSPLTGSLTGSSMAVAEKGAQV